MSTAPLNQDFSRYQLDLPAWEQSLQAIVDPLIPALDRPHTPWQTIFTWCHQPRTSRRAAPPALWVDWLTRIQDHTCFWCHLRMASRPAHSVEHVIPLGSPIWERMTRIEQLLTLRISHPRCNHGYRRWRATQSPPDLQDLDHQRWTAVQAMIARIPLLTLYAYDQYRIPPDDR